MSAYLLLSRTQYTSQSAGSRPSSAGRGEADRWLASCIIQFEPRGISGLVDTCGAAHSVRLPKPLCRRRFDCGVDDNGRHRERRQVEAILARQRRFLGYGLTLGAKLQRLPNTCEGSERGPPASLSDRSATAIMPRRRTTRRGAPTAATPSRSQSSSSPPLRFWQELPDCILEDGRRVELSETALARESAVKQ